MVCVCCHFKQQAYGDFEHNQTRNHPENAKILQAWKAVVDSYSTKDGEKKALIITADDDLNATLKYMKAGVALVRVNPLSGNGASLAERIETTLKNVHSVIKRIGWMVSIYHNHTPASKKRGVYCYSSRCPSVCKLFTFPFSSP